MKIEFNLLLCTDTQKYSALGEGFTREGGQVSTVMVSSISVAVGTQLGLAAGVVSPWVILLLLAVLKLGKEAFCRSMSQQAVPDTTVTKAAT